MAAAAELASAAPPRRGGLERLLAVIAVASIVTLAIGFAARPLSHDDLFGHLRTSEWMAAHHQVPRQDPFSFTRPGAPWISHEWGFSLLVGAVDAVAGKRGLRVLAALLTLAIGVAVAARARRLAAWPVPASQPRGAGIATSPPILLSLLLAVGCWAVAPELFLRASLVGELCLALLLLLLERFAATGSRRELSGIVALFLLWGNLHSSALFGLAVLALATGEAALGRFLPGRAGGLTLRQRSDRLAAYAGTLVAALAAALLNPNGAAALLYPVYLGRLLFASDIPWDLAQFSASSPAHDSALLLLIVLFLAAALPLSRLRLLSPFDVALFLLYLALSFRSQRFVFDFVVVGVPVLYRLLSRTPVGAAAAIAEPAAPLKGGRARRLEIAGAALAVLVLAGSALAVARALPRRDVLESFPEGACSFMLREQIDGHLFNHQNMGGFLSWRLRVPVFWDGRNDVFASLVREVTTTPFATTVARYGIDVLFITEREYDDLRPELTSGRWGLVYWDDFSAIYLRRVPRLARHLARLELRLFPPFGGRPGLAGVAADRRMAAAVHQELGRVLAENPTVQRALYFDGLLSLYEGEFQAGERRLLAALAVRPNEQVAEVIERIEETKRRLVSAGTADR
jgi:hypothetical protein